MRERQISAILKYSNKCNNKEKSIIPFQFPEPSKFLTLKLMTASTQMIKMCPKLFASLVLWMCLLCVWLFMGGFISPLSPGHPATVFVSKTQSSWGAPGPLQRGCFLSGLRKRYIVGQMMAGHNIYR